MNKYDTTAAFILNNLVQGLVQTVQATTSREQNDLLIRNCRNAVYDTASPHQKFGHDVIGNDQDRLHDRDPKIHKAQQHDGRNAEIKGRAGGLDEPVDGLLAVAGHGGDRVVYILAVNGKHRQNQIVGGQYGFPYHSPQRFGLPQSSRPVFGK